MKILEKTARKLLSSADWVSKPMRRCLDVYESLYGPVYARRGYKEAQKNGRSIVQGLSQIRQRWPDVQSEEQQSPVFILSAGWRSGSTLMQRLVMSRQSILLWGEPYSHARIITHLAAGISAITKKWPEEEWFIDRYDLDKLDKTFIANMYPPVEVLQQACLAYFKTMLDNPARERGFHRWGLKDVRLTIEDAYFLKWLYPKAKFVFICRNPYDAYRSYRLDRSWYLEWPDKPVFTAREFGAHWARLASGFHEGAEDIGGIFIRYEDLTSMAVDFDDIQDYLELRIDASILEKKVGSHNKAGERLPRYEYRLLKKEVDYLATVLDYKYAHEK